MKIQLNRLSADFCGERCYVHARGLILPGGNGIITLQKLELSGCDVFYGIEMMKTSDYCESLGNYNTQQHWLAGSGRLFLVYTRRAENNSHIFRHRAPLFIAEFDPSTMRVKRETEKIAVPERGARLGNFGCQSFSDEVGYIFASEWMQNGHLGWESCALRGSDNSIFLAKILYE